MHSKEYDMKKFIVGMAVAAVVALALHVTFSYAKEAPSKSSNVRKIASETELMTILDSSGSRLMVFDLYADWCGPCRMLNPRLEALADKYRGRVDFYRINVDANPSIASTFGVSGIPYVVFVKDRQAITSLVGLNPAESYEKVISACAGAHDESCEKVLNTL
jgi:thioredoxin 1